MKQDRKGETINNGMDYILNTNDTNNWEIILGASNKKNDNNNKK